MYKYKGGRKDRRDGKRNGITEWRKGEKETEEGNDKNEWTKGKAERK